MRIGVNGHPHENKTKENAKKELLCIRKNIVS